MEKVFDYIEKYKFAILGTFLFHIMVFIISNFSTVQSVQKIPPNSVKIEIPLDDIEFEPEIEELLQLQKPEVKNQEIFNLAKDENDNREKSYENYSTNSEEMKSNAMDKYKNLEQQYLDEWAATNADKLNDLKTNQNNKENKNENAANNKGENVSSGKENAFAGEVMISFNLSNRKAYSLPNPGYTCNGAGTVVVQIKVDKNGYVKETSYMAQSSSNASECMIERALIYAKKSRFDYVENSTSQTGTITYKFVSK